jgi:hypothetical protein
VPNLWTIEDDALEPDRSHHLRHAPGWDTLVQAVRASLRTAIESNNARFWVEESGRDSRDLRYVVQFPLGTLLFNWLFNGTTGYRAQFRIGRENGLAKNAQLISEVTAELERFATTEVVIPKYTSDGTYKEST